MRGIALLVAALAVAWAAPGCARKPSTPGTKGGGAKPATASKPAPINVATTAGSADKRDSKNGKRVYSIAWKTAALTLGEGGIQEGSMNTVSGTIFQDEKPSSTFTADTGYAKKESRTLRLERRVTVRSSTSKAVLTAEKLEWLPDVKRLRASGKVVVTDGTARIEAPALDATPDLRKVGTPEAFGRTP